MQDRLGSLRDVADATGAGVDHIDYDGFGKVVAESAPSLTGDFTYTGLWRQRETETFHAFWRDYGAAWGGWMQDDPSHIEGGGDPNVRRYSGNNPTNAVDPTGLAALPPASFLAAAMGQLPAPAVNEAELVRGLDRSLDIVRLASNEEARQHKAVMDAGERIRKALIKDPVKGYGNYWAAYDAFLGGLLFGNGNSYTISSLNYSLRASDVFVASAVYLATAHHAYNTSNSRRALPYILRQVREVYRINTTVRGHFRAQIRQLRALAEQARAQAQNDKAAKVDLQRFALNLEWKASAVELTAAFYNIIVDQAGSALQQLRVDRFGRRIGAAQ